MCCGKFVGMWECLRLAIEYDVRIVNHLLMVCFEQLNPYIVINAFIAIVTVDVGKDFEENMFDVGTSIKKP
jgi:hypothetical protein